MHRKKGIILAGGTSSRLYPVTRVMSKQLMPVYDKPMIYYPLGTLMLGEITDILIITRPDEQAFFKRLLGDGSQWGIAISYAAQPRPGGLAEAFLIGREFVADDPVTLILGDNIFYGEGLARFMRSGAATDSGACICAYYVTNPQDYGVVEFRPDGSVESLEEKPIRPRSS